ncbi:MAG: hypothetical protein MUO54_04800 [Anaerolineales bacterium]|nr:hypothetical protein [Anaerolineales bacterium]
MMAYDERLEILEMIQRGTISAEEGLTLLEALGESQASLDQEYLLAKSILEGGVDPEMIDEIDSVSITEDLKKWRRWWIIPFWTGVIITVLGGSLLYWAWSSKGIGLGFILAWIPFLIGVGILVLGWNSQTGPWLHLRIQQKPGETPERIAFSFPLPIRFFAWSLRTFGNLIPGLDGTGVDEIILALGDSSKAGTPLFIDVNDNDDGEQVKIYIG